MANLLRPLQSVIDGVRATRRSLIGGPGHRGPPSDHFDGKVFRNPAARAGKSFSDFLRWQRTRRKAQWPTWVENRVIPDILTTPAANEVALTFINHITFLLQFRGLNVLTDPVFSERVSPVQWAGPRRVHAAGVALEALPRIDLVLLSHNHFDHLDIATLSSLAKNHQSQIVTGLGNAAFLAECDLPGAIDLDWWQATTTRGAEAIFTPAQHWSGRGLRGPNRTLWGGFLLRVGPHALYFAGDTGYGGHFRLIRERLGQPTVSLLPIGAYEPRWFMAEQHMNPDDAVRAHLDLGSRVSIATHFGCFQLTDEGIDEPVSELGAARVRHAVHADQFRVPEVGETIRLAAGAS